MPPTRKMPRQPSTGSHAAAHDAAEHGAAGKSQEHQRHRQLARCGGAVLGRQRQQRRCRAAHAQADQEAQQHDLPGRLGEGSQERESAEDGQGQQDCAFAADAVTAVAASAISASASATAANRIIQKRIRRSGGTNRTSKTIMASTIIPPGDNPLPWSFLWLLWNFRARPGERDAGILRDDVRHPRRHEQRRAAVVALPQEGNRLAAEAAHFAVRQDRLQPVSDLDAVFPILHGQQDQNSVIGGFAADPPLLEQVDGVALDVRTVQRIDGHDRDLRVGLLFNLLADVIQLRNGALIEDMGEVVDVIGGTQLRDRLSVEQKRKRQQDDGADRFHNNRIRADCIGKPSRASLDHTSVAYRVARLS